MKNLDSNFWLLLVLLVALAGFTWYRGGQGLVLEGLGSGGRMMVRFGALIAISFLIAGLAEQLVPREWVASALGEDSGLRGLVLATAAGVITPSGPFIAIPIAATLLKSGAAPPAVVTFLASWGLLALHRFVAWEAPILGFRMALLRWAACLLLPLLAGLAARLFVRA